MAQAPATGPAGGLASGLARALLHARGAGTLIARPDAGLTIDQAYDVQQAVFSGLGAPLAGYKLAATSPGAQRAMGLAGPLAGRIGAHELVAQTAPPPVPSRPARPFYAEAELLLRIGMDMPAVTRAPSLAELAASVDRVWAGIEICSSRFDNDDLSPAGIVADNCLLHAVIIGDSLAEGWVPALAHCDVVLATPGAAPVHGSADAVMGHPLHALGWLAAWLGQRGECLRRGQIIACGSMTGITPVAAEGRVTARFGMQGQAVADFTYGRQE